MNYVIGYKISIQKFAAFLYTNNKLLEKLTIPFTITSKRIKYLRINITKEVKKLYTDNYQKPMKETKDRHQAHGLEKLVLLKCPYYPKQCTGSM